MSGHMKYIMYQIGGMPIAVLFSATLSHDGMHSNMGLDKRSILSAGFVSVQNCPPRCYGESTSLKVRSRGEDSLIVAMQLGWEEDTEPYADIFTTWTEHTGTSMPTGFALSDIVEVEREDGSVHIDSPAVFSWSKTTPGSKGHVNIVRYRKKIGSEYDLLPRKGEADSDYIARLLDIAQKKQA